MIVLEIVDGIVRPAKLPSSWYDDSHFAGGDVLFSFYRRLGDRKRLFFNADERHLIVADSLADFTQARSFSQNARAVETIRKIGYCFPPDTLVDGIDQVPPGSCLRVSVHPAEGRAKASLSFGLLPEVEDACPPELVLQSLRESSPIPASLLFSGGVDSSLIAAACRNGIHGYFATGFEFSVEDCIEKEYAMTAAQALDIPLEYISFSFSEMLEDLPSIIALTGEPVCHIQTLLLYRLLREVESRSETVFLNGQGADALFGKVPDVVSTLESNRLCLPESLSAFLERSRLSRRSVNYYLNLIGDVDHTVLCWSACAEAFGKRMVYPFLQHLSDWGGSRVGENDGPKEKASLKNAARLVDVPDWILDRRKASFGPVSTRWGKLLDGQDSPSRERYVKWNALNLDIWKEVNAR